MEKKEILKNLDVGDIAAEHVVEYYTTSGGQLCVWDDGSHSMLYGSYPSSRCIFSLRNCDAGYQMSKKEVMENEQYLIDCLTYSIDVALDYEYENYQNC